MSGPIFLDVMDETTTGLVRDWRNQALSTLRTPFALTVEMQQDFYKNVICNRNSPHRYWAVRQQLTCSAPLVAMVGLTNIQWENGLAEISLIVDPKKARQGIGLAAVRLALDQAFDILGLKTVCGEVYHCNPAHPFWQVALARNGGYASVLLPRRKFWDGRLWDSDYFTFTKEVYDALALRHRG